MAACREINILREAHDLKQPILGVPVRRPLVIAEAASNHSGDVEWACELARAAKQAGADVVKYQIGISELTAETSPQHEDFGRLELSYKDWDQVRDVCHEIGIPWTASVWSEEAADYLACTAAPFVKIGSGDLTNKPTLEWAARAGKPLVLSTGMATEEEIATAMETWRLALDPEEPWFETALLACTVDYPSAAKDSNVARIDALKALNESTFVGYSSHCMDWRVPAYAGRMGADVVEAHFTLENQDDGSLGMEDFGLMVVVAKGYVARDWSDEFEREVWGGPLLGVLESEEKWLKVARRDSRTGLRS